MRNDDVKKITEIKQYLLDPPVSFKLPELAVNYIEDAINILSTYPDAKNVIEDFQVLSTQLKNKSVVQYDLRNKLKQAGIELGNLTNK